MEVLRVSPTHRRYSPEFKERAVRMVRQLRAETGQTHGTIQRVADQVGCGVESLRTWVKQAEIDAGEQPGTTTEDAARLRVLEQDGVDPVWRTSAIRRVAPERMPHHGDHGEEEAPASPFVHTGVQGGDRRRVSSW